MDLSGLPYVLLPMQLEDIETVAAIEASIFKTPWSAEMFRQEVTNHPAAQYLTLHYTERQALEERFPVRPWSLPHDHSLIGYGGLWQILQQGHVSTIAVRPIWRSRGLGEVLFAALVERAVLAGCSEVTLEVRLSKRPAQGLYAKYGFEVVGRRPHYYPDNREDAWIMSTPPIQTPQYGAMLAERVNRLRQRLLSEPQSVPAAAANDVREVPA
ncbi:MAG: ribosomal protein S18-alanine N-acetyltransferase [Chloroflexi bacterium]|nr:ribosomal protein S18-alanine N-acetyltransferase [Chloroflexota bacterium]